MLQASGLVSPRQLKTIIMIRLTSIVILSAILKRIDRSLEPRDGDIVVGYINEEFTIKYLDLSHRNDGYIELRPANKDFKPIRIDEDDDFEVWGVVIWTIKNWRKY